MNYIKTYEVFGLGTSEKTEFSKKKMDELLTKLKSRGYAFEKSAQGIVDGTWVYKGARFVGISPRYDEKKLDVQIYSKQDVYKTFPLTINIEELTNKIITFIKENETVVVEKRKYNR